MNSSGRNGNSMDTTARICRRITFLYANDMIPTSTGIRHPHHHDTTSTTTTTTSSTSNTTPFHYLQQSSVPFHQSAYTIHEFSCGGSGTPSSSTPKVVATTPISYSSSV